MIPHKVKVSGVEDHIYDIIEKLSAHEDTITLCYRFVIICGVFKNYKTVFGSNGILVDMELRNVGLWMYSHLAQKKELDPCIFNGDEVSVNKELFNDPDIKALIYYVLVTFFYYQSAGMTETQHRLNRLVTSFVSDLTGIDREDVGGYIALCRLEYVTLIQAKKRREK